MSRLDNIIIRLNMFSYFFSPTSILKSQLNSLVVGSLIYFPYEFHEDAAIPPKKLFGSLLLCIITKVGPFKIIKLK